ncbi:hypothetical protein JXR93_01325 [bacterium]|nr:hypothetical protein [bacterium]
MEKTYKECFLKVINDEINNPNIRVLYFQMGEPVSNDTIEKIENKLGFPLDPAIISLYKEFNGLIYRSYEIKPEIASNNEEIGKVWFDDKISWSSFCDDAIPWLDAESAFMPSSIRHIYFRTLEDIFLGEQYLIEEEDDDDDDDLIDDMYKSDIQQKDLYLFDAWHYFYPIMIEAREISKSFHVVMGSDYGACYDDYPKITFENYIKQFFYQNRFSNRYFGDEEFDGFTLDPIDYE